MYVMYVCMYMYLPGPTSCYKYFSQNFENLPNEENPSGTTSSRFPPEDCPDCCELPSLRLSKVGIFATKNFDAVNPASFVDFTVTVVDLLTPPDFFYCLLNIIIFMFCGKKILKEEMGKERKKGEELKRKRTK